MSALSHKLVRDLWGRKGALVALLVIMAIGVGAYVGMASVWRDLEGARRDYYRDQRLAHFVVDLKRLPEHMPDRVVLLLGQDDLFPYCVEYRRTIDGKDVKLVGMKLFQVNINVPIEPSFFLYNPGKQGFVNETDEFLKSLEADREVP